MNVQSSRPAASPTPRRLGLLVAALVLAETLAFASATGTTAAASDIPGDPMPGAVAAGRLGGAIYDVVYRIVVQPGFVIVASVSGTPGTDFDLYLFDSSATTVVSEVGLLTKSIGPTSTESISWPSRSGGTYYINLNGATDVEGDYRLTVQVIPDPTPPQLTIQLAGGRAATNVSAVPVKVTASDDISGVSAVALSGDGMTFGEWQPISDSLMWSFPAGDGAKRLWAKVMNGVGLESAVASDTIILDTVPPRLVEVTPSPGARVAGLRPSITVAFDEALDPASWLDLGLVVQSSTGALVPGAYSYDVLSNSGSFIPSQPLLAGAVYAITIGNVRDVAGNSVPSAGSWTLTPLTPTNLTATARPAVVTYRASSSIHVELRGAPLPASLESASSAGGGPFLPHAPVSMDTGQNSLIVKPTSNTTYRFTYPGTSSVAADQLDVRVLVRRTITLAGLSTGTLARTGLGRSVQLVAVTTPREAGLSISFKLYRFDAAKSRWVYAGSMGRSTDANGRAALTWIPATTGTYYWRAAVVSTAEYANNISGVYRWIVSR